LTQQYLYGNPNDKYKKKLFVDNGLEYVEVKARIIEPYGSPVPQPNTKELKIINAPSHIQVMGLSSYRTTLVLLFESKEAYVEYMSLIGWGHKYYDERGAIYLGAVDSVKATPVEANRRYKVEVGLILVKKDQYNAPVREHKFQDVTYGEEDINEMARLGIITTYDKMGNPVLYFYPGAPCTRAQFAAFLMRTKRLLEQMLRE
jgi:hypothetical protein